MNYDLFVIFPNTPLAKRISRETLKQLLASGQIQTDTPCVRAGDPTPLTAVEAIESEVSAAEAVQGGIPVAGGTPENPDGLTEQQRCYLLENGLTTPRYINDLTKQQGVGLIRGHRRRKALKRLAIAGAIVLVLVCAVPVLKAASPDLWNKLCSSDAPASEPAAGVPADAAKQSAPGKGTAVAAPAPAMSERKRRMLEEADKRKIVAEQTRLEEEAREKKKQQQAASSKTDQQIYEERQLEREKRDRERDRQVKINTWLGTNLWRPEFFVNHIGTVYDANKQDMVRTISFRGAGVMADLNGRAYFFVPLSVLADCDSPEARLLNGTVLNLRQRPFLTFGAMDVAAFYLGEVPAQTPEEQAALNGDDIDAVCRQMFKRFVSREHPDLTDTRVMMVVGPNRLAPTQIDFNRETAQRLPDGRWKLNLQRQMDVSGYSLFSVDNGDVIGVLGGNDLDTRGSIVFSAPDLIHLPEPTPVAWEDFFNDVKMNDKFVKRTRAMRALSLGEFDTLKLDEYGVRTAVESTAAKVKTAKSKQTPSLRDTTRIMDVFRDDLTRLAKEEVDPVRITIPYFRINAVRDRALRLEYLDKIVKNVKDTDFILR